MGCKSSSAQLNLINGWTGSSPWPPAFMAIGAYLSASFHRVGAAGWTGCRGAAGGTGNMGTWRR